MTEARTDTEPGRIEHLNNPPTEAGFSLPNIAERIFNTPHLIHPDKLQAILWAVSGKLGIQVDRPTDPGVLKAASGGSWMNFNGAQMIVEPPLAIIPITGTLVNRGFWVGTHSGLQSYEGIAQQLRLAESDDRIERIVLDLNTYGGEAAGVDDLASEIREISQTKPVSALIADAAASAGYYLASAASEIVTTTQGMGGSIGVVLTHGDFSGKLQQDGISVTQLHAGARKLVGSPYRPLSDQDKAELQEAVDLLHDQFVAAVASYRTDLSEKDIRATEARTYRGARLVDQGLADRVLTGRELTRELTGRTSGSRRTNSTSIPEGDAMTTKNEGGANPAAEDKTFTQADLDARLAEQAKQQKTAVAEAEQKGAKAERDRISAILSCDEAANRPKMAQHLALKTDTSAEDAQGLLAAAAEEQAPKADPVAAAMQGKSPGVSSDDGGADIESEASEEEQAANFILNA